MKQRIPHRNALIRRMILRDPKGMQKRVSNRLNHLSNSHELAIESDMQEEANLYMLRYERLLALWVDCFAGVYDIWLTEREIRFRIGAYWYPQGKRPAGIYAKTTPGGHARFMTLPKEGE